MMTAHYETSTMSMMLRLPCWSLHNLVRYMAEWFTVVRVDEHTRPSDQYVCIYPDPPDVWTPWYYDISTLHGPTHYVYPQQ